MKSICLIISLLFAITCTTKAEVYYWSGGESGIYGDASNWSPVGIPGSADSVIIDLTGLTGTGTGIDFGIGPVFKLFVVLGVSASQFELHGSIKIETGDMILNSSVDAADFRVIFSGPCLYQSGSAVLERLEVNNGAALDLGDNLFAFGQVYVAGLLDVNGNNITCNDFFVSGLTGALEDVGSSTIQIIPGLPVPRCAIIPEFDLENCTIEATEVFMGTSGTLGNANIYCDRFKIAVGLSGENIDAANSTIYMNYRTGGSSENDEGINVPGATLNRVVLRADNYTAFGIYTDTINELIFESGVDFDHLEIHEGVFNFDSVHVNILQIDSGAILEAPGMFDVAMTSDNPVCADWITLRNIRIFGSSNYNAGVNSIDLGGNTGWDFTNCGTTVSCTTAPVGLTSTETPSGVALQWSPLPDALAYRVRGRIAGMGAYRFLPGIITATPTPSAFVNGSVLTPLSFYEWQVIASCSPDNSVISPFSINAGFFYVGPEPKLENAVISVYPNPVSEQLIIAGIKPGQLISIFNNYGEQIYFEHALSSQIMLDVREWNLNYYIILSDGEVVGKIVKAM